MKELVIEYKLIDHTTKQMTKHIHCVKLPWEMNISHDDVEQIKNQAKNIFEHLLSEYKLVKEGSSMKEKKIVVDGALKQVKFYKKCCYKYSKGSDKCDEAEVFKYTWLEGSRTKSEYLDGILQQKNEKTMSDMKMQQQPAIQQQAQNRPIGFLESLGLTGPEQEQKTTVLTGGNKTREYKLRCLH